MDNIKVQKPKNQKKEEKNSLINNNKKNVENKHKNPRRGIGKISKISINVEPLINEKKQKKNDKKKENKIKSKSSDNKKELPKSKSPQNKDDAKLSTKKDIITVITKPPEMSIDSNPEKKMIFKTSLKI